MAKTNGEGTYSSAFRSGLRPPRIVRVSDWADNNRVLTRVSSAEPGQWRTSRVPYTREPMDLLSVQSKVQKIVLMWGSQLGKTESSLNWLGYVIDVVPAPMMLVLASDSLIRRTSQTRITPMIEGNPKLAAKVAAPRSRNASNTITRKDFDGGTLILCGANSPAELSSTPVRFLMLDEVDRFESDIGGEGDPVNLALARTATYGLQAKVLLTSTPTMAGLSRIEHAYQLGDQRRYEVPCPHCLHYFVMEWEYFRYVGRDEPVIICPTCAAEIVERHKSTMLPEGRWVATNAKTGQYPSYQLSSLYSPLGWLSWRKIADKYEEAKDKEEALKTFYNTILGLPYEANHAKAIQVHALMARFVNFDLECLPEWVLLLTAGVDVQDDRLECTIWGWGRKERSVPLRHYVIWGEPSQRKVWQELMTILNTHRKSACGGTLYTKVAAVDTGGHYTQSAYNFIAHEPVARGRCRLIAIKGAGTKNKPIISNRAQGKMTSNGNTIGVLPLQFVGTDTAKELIYKRLALEPDAEGAIILHNGVYTHAETYLKQLTAEKCKITYTKGFPRQEWILPPNTRNEALDCAVYALAAYYIAIQGEDADLIMAALERELTPAQPIPEPQQPTNTMSSGANFIPQMQPQAPSFVSGGSNWLTDI